MKQTARIISTYSADTFGVCSALYELGGMVIMHDASGCNSTYTTHDEPRWYDMDSMIYISGLSEMEALMGDDEKLIRDIVQAAKELHPAFIAIAGTPIPAMTGFDFTAAAAMIEERTGIPALGIPTTGMKTYVSGASMALEGIARRFADRTVEKTKELSVNLLGVTPLDFSVNGTDRSMVRFLEESGFRVISKWAMGSSLEELKEAGEARVNLVVSSAGLGAAKAFKEIFGTPYVIGTPIGSVCQERIRKELLKAAGQTVSEEKMEVTGNAQTAVIGEAVISRSLAEAIEGTYGESVQVLCATECEKGLLRKKDLMTPYEEEVQQALLGMKRVIADPLYQPICPKEAEFIPLPAESFSGRIYRKEIPDLTDGFEQYFGRYFK